jgi:hypothetical protein
MVKPNKLKQVMSKSFYNLFKKKNNSSYTGIRKSDRRSNQLGWSRC